MFDYSTLKCDDFILDKAAKGIIDAYKTYVIKFFKNLDTYENLERILNVFPMKHPPFVIKYSAHVSFGLILAHYFERPYFNSLIQEYETFSNTMHKEIKAEMLDMLNKTLKFIEQNDVKRILDN